MDNNVLQDNLEFNIEFTVLQDDYTVNRSIVLAFAQIASPEDYEAEFDLLIGHGAGLFGPYG